MTAGLRTLLTRSQGGAAELLLEAIHWLQQNPQALSGELGEETMELLRTGRPAMQGFTWLADQVAGCREPGGRLARLEEEVLTSNDRIALEFAEGVRGTAPVSLLTLSESSTVLHALQEARAHVAEVHVLRSEPGGEGARTAEVLSSAGMRVEVVEDERLAEAVNASGMGVIGADTLFADCSVLNKVGSREMAEALLASGKPLHVLAASWKRSSLPGDDYRPSGGDRELFEVVPARLISRIFEGFTLK